MDFLKKNRMYIGIVLLLAAGFWVYMTYFTGSSGELLTSNTSSPLSQDVLLTLSNLNTLKLDDSIFSDPVFTSLSDYSVAIPPEAAGRRNPFAPF
jgi:hypothetical protein